MLLETPASVSELLVQEKGLWWVVVGAELASSHQAVRAPLTGDRFFILGSLLTAPEPRSGSWGQKIYKNRRLDCFKTLKVWVAVRAAFAPFARGTSTSLALRERGGCRSARLSSRACVRPTSGF